MGSRKQVSESTESKPAKKSDVKHKLQEFVLQKKQREILNNINNNLGQVSEAGMEEMPASEMESADAEVSSLLSSTGPPSPLLHFTLDISGLLDWVPGPGPSVIILPGQWRHSVTLCTSHIYLTKIAINKDQVSQQVF